MKTRYLEPRPVHNVYLVRERDRQRRRELLQIVVVALPLALALLAYIWLNVEVLDSGYRIDAADRQLRTLEQEERRLKLEAAALAHPAALERRAADELGLAPPRPEQLLYLEPPPTDATWGEL